MHKAAVLKQKSCSVLAHFDSVLRRMKLANKALSPRSCLKLEDCQIGDRNQIELLSVNL